MERKSRPFWVTPKPHWKRTVAPSSATDKA